MSNWSFTKGALTWATVILLTSSGPGAFAQAEPTLTEVYAAVQSGQLDKAQTMMQQVLLAHPNSAKAHFVQAELSAKRGLLVRAREELARAETLAPGLPFAKAESVQHLRSQLATQVQGSPPLANAPMPMAAPVEMGKPADVSAPFPWGLTLGLGGLIVGVGIFLSRRKARGVQDQARFAQGNSPIMNGPVNSQYPGSVQGGQNFGASAAMAPPYGQSPAGGLGGKVVGGLATGLAVGAGVLAAQSIGRSLMGGNEHHQQNLDGGAESGFIPINLNQDAGGQNFGVTDSSSWDDNSGGSGGGDGGGWDSSDS